MNPCPQPARRGSPFSSSSCIFRLSDFFAAGPICEQVLIHLSEVYVYVHVSVCAVPTRDLVYSHASLGSACEGDPRRRLRTALLQFLVD